MKREEKAILLEKEIKKENNLELRKKITKILIKTIGIIFLLFILLMIYMNLIGTKGLIVKEYKVENNNLPESFHGFKIVHFSDLHYLSSVKEKKLNTIINKINELRPNMVIFTGDLLDSNKNYSDNDIKILKDSLNKINASNLYAIKGENDYDNDYFEKIFNDTKFKILNNSYDLIYYKDTIPIMITGTGSILKNDCDIDKAFSYDMEDNLYTISLIHEPDITDNILTKYKTDLILAGHSHNGQIIIPGTNGLLKMDEANKYPNSNYRINNTNLFVSGGLGTTKYDFRLFNHPSINLYRLVKSK